MIHIDFFPTGEGLKANSTDSSANRAGRAGKPSAWSAHRPQRVDKVPVTSTSEDITLGIYPIRLLYLLSTEGRSQNK
jgi:hypothetical protein